MKETPLLFKGEMVRATLDGRKTVTRRLRGLDRVNESPDRYMFRTMSGSTAIFWGLSVMDGMPHIVCPYGQPGDRLWVRETIYNDGDGDWMYADGKYIPDVPRDWANSNAHRGVVPSIHMPRWASRIMLEITAVRVERLQKITDDGIKSEGVLCDPTEGHFGCVYAPGETPAYFMPWRRKFIELWDSVNGAGAWDKDPHVWVVEFKVVAP